MTLDHESWPRVGSGEDEAPRIAVVGGLANATNRTLVERWRALGLDVVLMGPGPLAPDDLVLARIDVRPSLDGIEPGLLDVAASLRRGARVLNRPSSIMAAHDKLRAARVLRRSGLPHPRTEQLRPRGFFPFPPPFVLKPRFGSWGRDVLRCDTWQDAQKGIELLSTRPWFTRQGAVVQELVKPLGYDVRVLVAGGQVVGCIERVAAPGEWRTNVSLGGFRRRARPTEQAVSLALAAVDAAEGDFFGVDLLPDGQGYVVLELNAAVEFDDTYGLDNTDVFAAVASALKLHPTVRKIEPGLPATATPSI